MHFLSYYNSVVEVLEILEILIRKWRYVDVEF
jgi:hypothetical protein